MKYYCIGIKGAGMSTLAQILHDLGNEVVGYDDVKDYKFTEDGLHERNIKIYNDSSYNLDRNTIVTYSAAFSNDHPELKRVNELGLTIKKYHDILGEITKLFKTISVCGTHGKTTTSSLISHVLKKTKGCNYFIGDGSGFASKENELFVIESCEFNRHFLAYYPSYTVITNIELEHTECFEDIDDIIKTFEEFANKSTEKIIACGDDENIRKINFQKEVLYYGFSKDNDLYADNIVLTDEGSSFDVYYNQKFYGNFNLPLFGKHMILNTLACILVAINENIEYEKIFELLKIFKNAKRRFSEQKIKNNIIIDDYAHHPTEIKVTLESARQKYPNKEIVAIFKPNTYSRTKDFKDEFIEVLKLADKTYITPIECNREKQEDYPKINSNILLEKIPKSEIITEESIEKLLCHNNSVLCFMSCASVSHLIDNYKKITSKNI